jgi:hypothetical protein
MFYLVFKNLGGTKNGYDAVFDFPPTEMAGSGMMEETVISLPYLEDSILYLGDLWDCRTCTSLENLFDDIPASHVEAHPIGSSDYTLSNIQSSQDKLDSLHVAASISIELLGGSLKIAGSASFDQSSAKEFRQEELFCQNLITTSVVRLKPSVANIVSLPVKERIISGNYLWKHVTDIPIVKSFVIYDT